MTPEDPAYVHLPGPWSHRHVSANGIRLHVAEQGRGPLVLFLHGFGEFWWAWRHQLPAVAEDGFRAVAMDLRGYGDSDKTPRGYDGWTAAGDAAGLIRALGESRAHLVGHGWGGLVAWAVAAMHPRLVSSLTVVGAPHPVVLRRRLARSLLWPPGILRRLLIAQVPMIPERRIAAGYQVLSTLSGPGWRETADFTEALEHNRRAARIPNVAHCGLEYLRWAMRSQLRPDGFDFAAAMRRPAEVPVTAVLGALDSAVPVSTVQASEPFTAAGFALETMAGAGHYPHQESPAEFNALLRKGLLM
ncbi:alpha/beta hydrolase [Pseudonocardiaceae bacterium YIM PH 21723]|nr:alpha/beta hydrolase [Pseudonocardiaceae bacterium YIM PH 21723]